MLQRCRGVGDRTFDDGHALFCTATEKNGRLVHGAHLVDARGELLAYETGPAESSAILAAVSGKCLAGGAVLVEIVNLCFEGDPSS